MCRGGTLLHPNRKRGNHEWSDTIGVTTITVGKILHLFPFPLLFITRIASLSGQEDSSPFGGFPETLQEWLPGKQADPGMAETGCS